MRTIFCKFFFFCVLSGLAFLSHSLQAEPNPTEFNYTGVAAPAVGRPVPLSTGVAINKETNKTAEAARNFVNDQKAGIGVKTASDEATRRQLATDGMAARAGQNEDSRRQTAIVHQDSTAAGFTDGAVVAIITASVANSTTQMQGMATEKAKSVADKLNTSKSASSGTAKSILNYLAAACRAGCFSQEQVDNLKLLQGKNGLNIPANCAPKERTAGSFLNPDLLLANGCIRMDGDDMTCLLAGASYRAAGGSDLNKNGSNAADDAKILFASLSAAAANQSKFSCEVNRFVPHFCVKMAQSGDAKVYAALDKYVKEKGSPLRCRKGEQGYAPSQSCLEQMVSIAQSRIAGSAAGERGMNPAKLQALLAQINTTQAVQRASATKAMGSCSSNADESKKQMEAYLNSPAFNKWLAENDIGEAFEASLAYYDSIQGDLKREYAAIIQKYNGGEATMYAEEKPVTPALADVMKQAGINSTTFMPIYPDATQQMAIKEQPHYVPQATLISTNGISAQQ